MNDFGNFSLKTAKIDTDLKYQRPFSRFLKIYVCCRYKIGYYMYDK